MNFNLTTSKTENLRDLQKKTAAMQQAKTSHHETHPQSRQDDADSHTDRFTPTQLLSRNAAGIRVTRAARYVPAVDLKKNKKCEAPATSPQKPTEAKTTTTTTRVTSESQKKLLWSEIDDNDDSEDMFAPPKVVVPETKKTAPVFVKPGPTEKVVIDDVVEEEGFTPHIPPTPPSNINGTWADCCDSPVFEIAQIDPASTEAQEETVDPTQEAVCPPEQTTAANDDIEGVSDSNPDSDAKEVSIERIEEEPCEPAAKFASADDSCYAAPPQEDHLDRLLAHDPGVYDRLEHVMYNRLYNNGLDAYSLAHLHAIAEATNFDHVWNSPDSVIAPLFFTMFPQHYSPDQSVRQFIVQALINLLFGFDVAVVEAVHLMNTKCKSQIENNEFVDLSSFTFVVRTTVAPYRIARALHHCARFDVDSIWVAFTPEQRTRAVADGEELRKLPTEFRHSVTCNLPCRPAVVELVQKKFLYERDVNAHIAHFGGYALPFAAYKGPYVPTTPPPQYIATPPPCDESWY